MEHASVQRPLSGARARHRFALGGVALALSAGLGTPLLSRSAADAWSLPFEAVFLALATVVAVAFLSIGWALGRRVELLSDEARRDPVTKIGNRRHWEECLAHEVERAARARMPLSLLLIDVDHLKRVNDELGHAAGDHALSMVGEVLSETCRSRDVAARFGGDEFAVLLPRTRASEAQRLAERVRSGLAERRSAHGGPLAPVVTVSIGICDLASLAAPHPRLLFEAADRALYTAKQAGRDRVEVFEKTPSPSTVIYLDERRRNRHHTR